MATLPQKVELLRGLMTGETAYTGPLYVAVDITQRCNLQCVGCIYHSPYGSYLDPGILEWHHASRI